VYWQLKMYVQRRMAHAMSLTQVPLVTGRNGVERAQRRDCVAAAAGGGGGPDQPLYSLMSRLHGAAGGGRLRHDPLRPQAGPARPAPAPLLARAANTSTLPLI
jgi:hypothetical protein